MKKTILFSTTRQWNPGDEFILFGVMNLLNCIFPKGYNPVIYNRNPDIRQEFQSFNPLRKTSVAKNIRRIRSPFVKSLLDAFLRIDFRDNSFKGNFHRNFVDLAIFAGSPEWTGPRLTEMFHAIASNNIPILFLGIGSGRKLDLYGLPQEQRRIIKKARLITVRDKQTLSIFKEGEAYLLPCPALMAVERELEKVVTQVRRIGFIFGTHKSAKNNNLSVEASNYLFKLYSALERALGDQIAIEIVCHYIDEIPEAKLLFPERMIHYTYDAREYINIFRRFDMVIGARVHGIGLAASIGIPGVMVTHDIRSGTVDGFLSEKIAAGSSFSDAIEKIRCTMACIASKNLAIRQHKNKTRTRYLELLQTALS